MESSSGLTYRVGRSQTAARGHTGVRVRRLLYRNSQRVPCALKSIHDLIPYQFAHLTRRQRLLISRQIPRVHLAVIVAQSTSVCGFSSRTGSKWICSDGDSLIRCTQLTQHTSGWFQDLTKHLLKSETLWRHQRALNIDYFKQFRTGEEKAE